MLLNVATWECFFAVLVWTSNLDVVAHIHDQTRGFAGSSIEEVSSTCWTLHPLSVVCLLLILIVTSCAEGVVALEDDGLYKGYVAYRAYQMRVIFRNVVERSKVDLRLLLLLVQRYASGLSSTKAWSRGRSRWRITRSASSELGEQCVKVGLNRT